MTFDLADHERKRKENAQRQGSASELKRLALEFVIESDRYGYAYQWSWLGLPVIQMPADILALQEIIWTRKPDVVIETGVAWGGSLALYATILGLTGGRLAIGIDLNLAPSVSSAVAELPVSERIHLIKGDSVAGPVLGEVRSHIEPGDDVMVILDSNHTEEHVLGELRAYAPLVTRGQYIVVSDTVVEDMPEQEHRPRPWGPGNNPRTALNIFLSENPDFEDDVEITHRLLTSYNPHGYVRRIR